MGVGLCMCRKLWVQYPSWDLCQQLSSWLCYYLVWCGAVLCILIVCLSSLQDAENILCDISCDLHTTLELLEYAEVSSLLVLSQLLFLMRGVGFLIFEHSSHCSGRLPLLPALAVPRVSTLHSSVWIPVWRSSLCQQQVSDTKETWEEKVILGPPKKILPKAWES